jgi:sporulation protein YlmC with PRC-barrel domain
MTTPRRLDAALRLLDRQLVDPDGHLVGKVDDLELTIPEDGGPPYVSAILAGPGALARRLGGSIGAWLEGVHARLQKGDEQGPSRIPFDAVEAVDADVKLRLHAASLPTHKAEEWTSDHIIGRIPGAQRATE